MARALEAWPKTPFFVFEHPRGQSLYTGGPHVHITANRYDRPIALTFNPDMLNGSGGGIKLPQATIFAAVS